jgi:hypothetical protein
MCLSRSRSSPKRLHSCDREVGCFHEADYVSHVCDPPSGAWSTLVELLQTYSARNGIDPLIGRKLPRLLREAGLIDVRVNPSFTFTRQVTAVAASCWTFQRT